jgi:hypothetical protein
MTWGQRIGYIFIVCLALTNVVFVTRQGILELVLCVCLLSYCSRKPKFVKWAILILIVYVILIITALVLASS